MKGSSVFIDTNIFIYSIDSSNKEKSDLAEVLIKKFSLNNELVVSFQIVQEFINTCSRKRMSKEAIDEYIKTVLFPIWDIYPSRDLYLKAMEVQKRYQYSFYDSLIIAAALESNCKTLYSEDLQDGQKIESLTIVDPFK